MDIFSELFFRDAVRQVKSDAGFILDYIVDDFRDEDYIDRLCKYLLMKRIDEIIEFVETGECKHYDFEDMVWIAKMVSAHVRDQREFVEVCEECSEINGFNHTSKLMFAVTDMMRGKVARDGTFIRE